MECDKHISYYTIAHYDRKTKHIVVDFNQIIDTLERALEIAKRNDYELAGIYKVDAELITQLKKDTSK